MTDHWRQALGVAATGLALWGAATGAARAALPDEAGLSKRIDALMQPYVDAGMYNGVVVVSEGGRIVLNRAYGMASYELNVANRPDTRFRIASLSKPITNAALLVLLERKRLTMDSRVSEFLPDFPRGRDISVKNLVEHRSGIVHTNELPEYDAVVRMTLADSIAILKTKPLAFEPDAKRAYSNGGYDVLAAVIEKAAGRPFEAFVQAEVLDKLGMKDTGWVETYRVIAGMAEGYAPGANVGQRARVRFYPPEARRGGGALYSTTRDMATFFRAYRGAGLVSPATKALLFTPGDQPVEYTGRAPGFTSAALVDPARDIQVVSLANNYGGFDSLGERIYKTATGQGPAVEATRERRRLTAKDAAFYAGRFHWDGISGSGHRLFVDADGDLVAEGETQERYALVPLTKNRWLNPMYDVVCTVEGTARLEALSCNSPVIGATGPGYRIVRDE